jgi:hypothetical protein
VGELWLLCEENRRDLCSASMAQGSRSTKKEEAAAAAAAGSRGGGAGWTSVAWAAGLLFAWTAVEIAFKPWLAAGRSAIAKSLDPDYDVDDELDRAPLPPSAASSSPQQQQKQEAHRIRDDDDDGGAIKKP